MDTVTLMLAVLVVVMAAVTLVAVRVKHRPCHRVPTRYHGFTITSGEPPAPFDHRDNWAQLSSALKNRLYD